MSSPTKAPRDLERDASDVATFESLGVPAKLARRLLERGIAAPFPIQAATIPDALDGRDVCGKAPTGSGKTIAFGIPLVLGVGRARPHKPRGLVLVPTRELATQVSDELQKLSKPKGPWVETFFGGVPFPKQVQALKRGVDIAVACPGRLADLVQQGLIDLSEIEIVVVDEADRMADMGFLPQVRQLLDLCPADRQTLLFSATLDGDVDVLVKRYQRNPVRHDHVVEDDQAERMTHLFWSVERPHRVRTTADVIARSGPTVVFCRTKRGADRVARQLGAAGVPAAAIHGDRSQAQRERALRAFHRGEVEALVATDVAARGIHVDGVRCVIHFDPPAESKDYVHRSGRTARAGASGLVVSLVPTELGKDVKKLQRELGHPVGLTEADASLVADSSVPVRAPEVDRDAQDIRAPRGRQQPRRSKSSAEKAKHESSRVPLAEGKRRPSGAARRKAKRLAAESDDQRTATTPARRRRPTTRGKSRRPTSGRGARSGPKRSR
jgi:superfamily II DNA/RNA helicase